MAEKFVEAISEETLDEVAGGLKIDKEKLKKALIGAGVTVAVLGLGTTGALAIAGKKGKGPMAGLFNKGNEIGGDGEEPKQSMQQGKGL